MTVRVLIVDDAAYIRRLVSDIVTDHDQGWIVAGEACTGREAIDVAGELDPDLVLLDLSMPVMDGLEALPHLRRGVPKATIVVLTGLASEVARDAAERAGAHGYLEKDALVSLVPKLESILDQVRRHVADDTATVRDAPPG